MRRSVDILLNTATTHAIDVWHSGWYEGAVLVRNGNFHEGQRVLLNAMDGPPYMEGNVHRLEMLIELSHAFACVDDFQQSSDILDDALADSARREERWCQAELLRMKGEVLLSVDAPDSVTRAEEVFLQSLDWARRQGALSWELRTASSLARLRRRQGRAREGRACFEPVYRQFKEGSVGELWPHRRNRLSHFW